MGFEPTISAGERPQTNTSDRAANGTGPAVLTITNKNIDNQRGGVSDTHSALSDPTTCGRYRCKLQYQQHLHSRGQDPRGRGRGTAHGHFPVAQTNGLSSNLFYSHTAFISLRQSQQIPTDCINVYRLDLVIETQCVYCEVAAINPMTRSNNPEDLSLQDHLNSHIIYEYMTCSIHGATLSNKSTVLS